MNTMIKTLAMLIASSIITTASAANTEKETTTSGFNLSIFKGKVVSPGSAVVAKVSLENAQTVQAVVTNEKGRKMLETPVTLEAGENQLRLHLGELPTGLYFLKIETTGRTLTRTFYVM